MQFLVLTIGKTKAAHFRAAISHYLESITHKEKIEYIELKDQDSDKEKEAEQLLQFLQKRKILGDGKNIIVLLDERGQSMDSPMLAEKIGKWRDTGAQQICFIVGGAFGIAEKVQSQANLKLSLSKMVFPHELARVIILEQIYRALHILSGSKYHHS